MASVLEQQLQRIAKAAGLAGDGGIPSQKGKASLVYSFREASDVGVEDLYEAGVRGEYFSNAKCLASHVGHGETSQMDLWTGWLFLSECFGIY